MNIISVSTIWPNQIHYNKTVICSQQHWSLPQWSSNSICEKKLCKGNISWAQTGPGRAELKLNRGERAQEILGPLFRCPFRALSFNSWISREKLDGGQFDHTLPTDILCCLGEYGSVWDKYDITHIFTLGELNNYSSKNWWMLVCDCQSMWVETRV